MLVEKGAKPGGPIGGTIARVIVKLDHHVVLAGCPQSLDHRFARVLERVVHLPCGGVQDHRAAPGKPDSPENGSPIDGPVYQPVEFGEADVHQP